jgi:hypothetical protein
VGLCEKSYIYLTFSAFGSFSHSEGKYGRFWRKQGSITHASQIDQLRSESTSRMAEYTTTIDYSGDRQISSRDPSLDGTLEQEHGSGGEEAFRDPWISHEGRSRSDCDDRSFVIPKDAEKAELSPDPLERTFEAIIRAHPKKKILESTKPTAVLLQLREVQELARDDQLRFQSWVIGRRCSQRKEKGKE